MPISSPNPIFDHLLESSHLDDSNKWSNIGFIEEIMHVVLIEANEKSYNILYNYTKLCSKGILAMSCKYDCVD